ncbi:MAG: phosphoribosylanthranilate isomerase [Xanthomonadales bacterium]|nr:phosphoribosylanthranilate isomerase [Xanthomonadales bacterium]
MNGVKVKICGLTRAADVDLALGAGADVVGFIFARSPRQLAAATGASLAKRAAGRALRVGLFMDQEASQVQPVIDAVALDLLQFHGSEPNEFCRSFGLPFIKAISMLDESADRAILSYPDAEGILLDSHVPGGAGGTGQTFDWNRPVASDKPIWLAGGLNPDNVAEAVRLFQPYAVDVCSGVESAPGLKDQDRVRNFITNAKQA